MNADEDLRLRSSVLCIENNRLLALKYEGASGEGFWGVPGGAVENHETPLQAALRETREETGYFVELTCDPQLAIEYDFSWQNKIYHCRTHWFGVRPIPGAAHRPRAGDEPYLTQLRWWPVAHWRQILAGHRDVQDAMCKLLLKMQGEGLVKLGN